MQSGRRISPGFFVVSLLRMTEKERLHHGGTEEKAQEIAEKGKNTVAEGQRL